MLEEARHHPQPYAAAVQALQQQYGQSHQLTQGEIASLLNSPDIKAGDSKAFQSFALQVDLLVGILTSLEGPNGMELMSTGHVDRPLSKLPKYLKDGFIEHLQACGRLQTYSLNPYNLRDFAEWLRVKAEVQRLSSKMAQWTLPERLSTGKGDKHMQKPRNQTPVAIYHGKSDRLRLR